MLRRRDLGSNIFPADRVQTIFNWELTVDSSYNPTSTQIDKVSGRFATIVSDRIDATSSGSSYNGYKITTKYHSPAIYWTGLPDYFAAALCGGYLQIEMKINVLSSYALDGVRLLDLGSTPTSEDDGVPTGTMGISFPGGVTTAHRSLLTVTLDNFTHTSTATLKQIESSAPAETLWDHTNFTGAFNPRDPNYLCIGNRWWNGGGSGQFWISGLKITGLR